MKCEHAQEFFSEYIESSLDKPTGVALEAHLTACAACQRDVEGLRQTWGALNAMPMVEPPKDLAWQVMVQLQQERLERLEADRQRRNPFVGWLQSLTPGAAFGYATLTALLIIAIGFPLRDDLGGIIFGPGWAAKKTPSPIVQPATSANEPAISFQGAYQDARSGLWFHRLIVTVPPSMGESRVVVRPMVPVRGQLSGAQPIPATVSPKDFRLIPVPVMVGGQSVQAALVRIQGGGRSVEKLVDVPVASGGGT